MSNEAKLESSTEIYECFDVPVCKNKGKKERNYSERFPRKLCRRK